MYTPNQILNFLEHRIDYSALLSHKDVYTDIRIREAKYNLFIPVRGRRQHLKYCIKYLKKACLKANIIISIIVIENDEIPRLGSFSKDLDVDYIFLPTSLTGNSGSFVKPLCFNVGFLSVPETPWSIFHDADIAVEEDYFRKLEKYANESPSWIQPYTKRRVNMVSPESTQMVFESKDLPDLSKLPGVSPAQPGSPGGSIVVKSKDFKNICGYDPILFHGYSPEDAFFWVKLEYLYRRNNVPLRILFEGSATYADTPPIETYHLHHEHMSGTNPKHEDMLEIYSSFLKFSYDEQKSIMDKIQQKQRLN